jgi:hypothetical protein
MILTQGAKYRHKKTGHIYELVGCCKWEPDGTHAVLYRRVNPRDDQIWARPVSVFMDGRFELWTDIV